LVLLITVLVLVYQRGWSINEPFSRWDAAHFIHLSTHGYTQATEAAFFPGLPGIMALFALIGIPAFLTGIIVSLVGSAMAAWALYRLAGGGVPGAVAVLAWSFAPMAVFTFVPYTESVFLAFALWSFWYAKRDQWGWAGVLAGASCLFRISGLFLIGALGLIALFGFSGSTWKRRMTRVAWLGIPMAVLGLYSFYLRVRFGSWMAWFQAQGEGWGRHFDWPWNGLIVTLKAAGIIGSKMHVSGVIFRWEFAVFLVGLIVVVACFSRRWIAEGGWVGVQWLALSCQAWFISMTRSFLLWFPVFLLIAQFAKPDLPRAVNDFRRGGFIALVSLEISTMIWWAHRYYVGAWAG
jgi:Gpi18-like mannosyltransferase